MVPDCSVRMRRLEALVLVALMLFCAAVYILYGLFRHWHFGSSAFDLGIFDQAVWHLSRLEHPESTIHHFSNVLGDHFFPVIVLFVPFYWIAPSPESLIVAQGLLFAASLLPVYGFLRGRLSAGPSLALAGAYGLFWGLQRAAAYDVHEIAFAPLVIGAAILAMERRRWFVLWGSVLMLVMIKEDLIPLVSMLGVYLFVRGERSAGSVLALGGVVAFLVVVQILIPSLSESGSYAHMAAYAESLQRPWLIPLTLVTPAAKLVTVLLWLAPFIFLPLFSPFAVLLLPIALSRLLSDNPNHWGASFHYAAPLAPILAMSAGDGLRRLADRFDSPRTRSRVVAGLSGSCVVLSLFLPGNQPLWDLFDARHYATTPIHRAGYEALRVLPADASVVAQAAVVPHLSQRRYVYVLGENAAQADFVIASEHLTAWPHANYQEIQVFIDEYRAMGYVAVFEAQGWTVLSR